MDLTAISSSSTQEPNPITTLSRKLKPKTSSSHTMGRVQESSRRTRRSRRKRAQLKKESKEVKNSEDEKTEVEKKMTALQQIVPGGEELGADKLFEKTAGYILALQFQVNALKVITDFIEGSDLERRKLGG